MEADDIVLLIVGDERNTGDTMHYNEGLEKVADGMEIEHLINVAEKHGQFMMLDTIKKEPLEHDEYLKIEQDGDEITVKEEPEEYEEFSENNQEDKYFDDEYMDKDYSTEYIEESETSDDEGKIKKRKKAKIKKENLLVERKLVTKKNQQEKKNLKSKKNLLIERKKKNQQEKKHLKSKQNLLIERNKKNQQEKKHLKSKKNLEKKPNLNTKINKNKKKKKILTTKEEIEKRKARIALLHKMHNPSEWQSFVQELCDQQPYLQYDEELLIKTLYKIMKKTKAPAPPKGYFIKTDVFECKTCGAKKVTEPAIMRHWQQTHGERYLKCFACGVDFRSTTNLYRHEQRCIAPYIETVLKARAMHIGARARSRPYKLSPADIPVSVKAPKPPVEKRFHCAQCPARFASDQGLSAHELAHAGKRPYSCRQCPAAYTSQAKLKRHVYLKHSNTEFICEHCAKVFRCKQYLATHLNTHQPLRKFCCETCGRRYSSKMTLQLHVLRKHDNLPPPCPCQICPRRFLRVSALKEHMLKVHGMELMTRGMYLKRLPMMTEMQVQQAKVVFKSDVTATESLNVP